jgi:septum formation protein
MNIAYAPQFILASASPRRKELLTKAGYRFAVELSGVDEDAYAKDGVHSEDHCMLLAQAKAKDVAGRFPDKLVLGADTVVDLDGEIIGKPDDAAHAEEITRKLFSKPHKVITGIALVCLANQTEIVEAVTTIVYPRQLTGRQIQEHIAGGLWEGKAGAYGIQETGDEFVDHIEGSFTNVMGLPMERVMELLTQHKIQPLV